MRERNTLNALFGTFCFAIFANHQNLNAQAQVQALAQTQALAQAIPFNWIQFNEQPKELINIFRHLSSKGSSPGFEAGLTTQKIVAGTDLNLFNFSCLYHSKNSFGLNLIHFGSPDFQTSQGALGYLWHHPKFDVAFSTQWQKSTLSPWVFAPGASVTYNYTKNSRFSAYYKFNESMGLGYHMVLKKGGMLNINYSVPSFSISENTHQFSCSFYYPAFDKIWLGIESCPQRRFNQLTLLYRVSDRLNAAIHSGYFSSLQTFNLSFYAGLSLP
jgi:hypothetical protein